jgi:hypothetical protein
MRAKVIACCVVAAAMAVSPAFASKKQETSTPAGVVGGAARTTGAVAGGAVATAGAIATAPFNPTRMGPVSTLNGPSCKPGSTVTINGRKMRCQ